MEPCSTVASPSAATSFLFDIVVFAGGTTDGFSPLCTNDPKPMLSICNRPMIWYCLYPLYKTGCRTFFICVNEDYVPLQSYLHKQFSDVNFIFILVPFEQNKRRSTTCDVVKAYLEHKETMQASSLRDALLLSCDTFLPGVDLEPFIRDFYCSAASVSVLLFRPLPKCPSSTSAWGGHGSPVKSYVHRRTCVAYEENNESIQRSPPSQNNNNNNNNNNDSITTTTTTNNNNNLMEDDDENINHHRDRHVHSKRLHFICPFEEAQELRLTLGFASRRPNLTFSSDVTDVHAYLVRNWALHAMAESSHDDISVQKDIIPMYARSQHCTINEKKKVFMKPEQKINYKIPKHWLLEGDCLMRFLNASSSQAIFPEDTDNLLVSCTIYDEDADTGMKAYRVRTREDYVAITQEILAAKSQLLDNNNNSGSYAKKKNTFTFSSASSFLPTDKKHGTSHLLFPLSHQSSLALSTLLPDDSFTVQWKDEENKMAINHSFVQSEPNCGVNISRSVVGKNVVLGTQVRITNSIILDNVEIGANTVITNSVIGASAMITSGVSVKNCTVGPHCVVESNETDRVIRT